MLLIKYIVCLDFAYKPASCDLIGMLARILMNIHAYIIGQ